jgi:hypothetical protein
VPSVRTNQEIEVLMKGENTIFIFVHPVVYNFTLSFIVRQTQQLHGIKPCELPVSALK